MSSWEERQKALFIGAGFRSGTCGRYALHRCAGFCGLGAFGFAACCAARGEGLSGGARRTLGNSVLKFGQLLHRSSFAVEIRVGQ